MNSKGKDAGRLGPSGGIMLAWSEWTGSPGSSSARLGASCVSLLGQLQSRGLRQTPSSSPNYGYSLLPGPFLLKLCGAVWSCGLGWRVGGVEKACHDGHLQKQMGS